MLLPKIQNHDGGLQIVDVFRGLNRAEKIEEGEWSEELNLTTDRYPMLSVRGKHAKTITLDDDSGTIVTMLAKDRLYLLIIRFDVEIPGVENAKSAAIHVLKDDGTTQMLKQWIYTNADYTPKTMISFGAYIIVNGINAWYNTADATSGYFNFWYTISGSEESSAEVFRLRPVDEEGTELTIKARLTAEEGAELEQSDDHGYSAGECYAIRKSRAIRQYVGGADGSLQWRTVPNAAKYIAAGIGTGRVNGGSSSQVFSVGDSIEIGGFDYMDGEFSGAKTVVGVDETNRGYLILKDAFVPYTSIWFTYSQMLKLGGPMTAGKYFPDLDYIVECNNRLWGCKYGVVDGKMVNELYCTELGTFDVWRNYDGTSMASWAASVGTDGPWTGAVNYNGSPYFFKEKTVHRIYISASGAHQVVDQTIRGVQADCGDSLCVLNGALYYMSRDGVCVYDGSKPVVISEALGDVLAERAFFGGHDHKLYCLIDEIRGEVTTPALYVYDTKRGIWHQETISFYGIRFAAAFATLGGSFYVCDATRGIVEPSEADEIALWDFSGLHGEPEDDVAYTCTSGLIGWQTNEQKYVTRFDMRLTLPEGATMKVEIEYDSDGEWHEQGTATGGGVGSVMIPVRPRRCDHFRIRLSGKGEMRMYSWAKRLEKGSDRV